MDKNGQKGQIQNEESIARVKGRPKVGTASGVVSFVFVITAHAGSFTVGARRERNGRGGGVFRPGSQAKRTGKQRDTQGGSGSLQHSSAPNALPVLQWESGNRAKAHIYRKTATGPTPSLWSCYGVLVLVQATLAWANFAGYCMGVEGVAWPCSCLQRTRQRVRASQSRATVSLCRFLLPSPTVLLFHSPTAVPRIPNHFYTFPLFHFSTSTGVQGESPGCSFGTDQWRAEQTKAGAIGKQARVGPG